MDEWALRWRYVVTAVVGAPGVVYAAGGVSIPVGVGDSVYAEADHGPILTVDRPHGSLTATRSGFGLFPIRRETSP